jgi:hypothetical protein
MVGISEAWGSDWSMLVALLPRSTFGHSVVLGNLMALRFKSQSCGRALENTAWRHYDVSAVKQDVHSTDISTSHGWSTDRTEQQATLSTHLKSP